MDTMQKEFTEIQPYMVVNKVFSSYYKHVQFPAKVTFGELKMELGLH